MTWHDTMIPIVRGLIFDMTSPQRHCDTRIEEIITVAGVLVIQAVDFSYTYTINPRAVTISPDPTDVSDDDFIALVCLRAACIFSHGEFRTAANSAVNVKDGPSSIDTGPKAQYLGGIADNICDGYTKAEFAYRAGDGSVGKAIIGPYNTGSSDDAGRRFS